MKNQDHYHELAANAKALTQTGNYGKAIEVWRIARSEYPGLAAAWSEPVYAALLANDFQLAELLAREAMTKAPQFLDSWAGWAQIATFRQDWREAARRWAVAGARFPGHALCPAREAQAWHLLGDLARASRLCCASLGLDRAEPIALLQLVQILLERQQRAAARSLALEAIKLWPTNPEFYVYAAKACICLEQYAEAECICLDGLSKAEDSLPLYLKYIQAGLERKDYAAAAGRCLWLRRKYPHHAAGYEYGAQTALLLKDERQAWEICKAALKLAPASLKNISLPESMAEGLLQWGGESLQGRDYNEALRRFKTFVAFFPARKEGYGEIAKVYKIQKRPREMEQTCLAAMAAAPLDSEIFELFIEACALQEKYAEVVNYSLLACNLFPGEKRLVAALVYQLLACGEQIRAKELFAAHENVLDKDCATERLRLAVRYQCQPGAFHHYLRQCVAVCAKYIRLTIPVGYNTQYYLNSLARLAETDASAQKRHFVCIETLLLPRQSNQPRTEPNKLCIYDYNLSYFSAVIRHIPPERIDFVCRGSQFDPDHIRRLGLEEYRVVDKARIGDYQYLISDANAYLHSREKAQSGQTVICYWHAVDAIGARDMPQVGAFVLPYQKSAEFNAIKLIANESRLLSALPNKNKCEIAYTGAYHIEPPKNMDKAALRHEIAKNYGFDIPQSKPLIFILHGELGNYKHYIYAINKMAEFAKVVYKSSGLIPCSILSKLNPDVSILQNGMLANNLFRYAADFIMAEFNGGTCMSSFMLGLPIIPFYTRICNTMFTLGKDYSISYNAYITKGSNSRFFDYNFEPKSYMISYLKDNNLLFDLLDTRRISDVIINNSWHELFAPHLPIIQERVFGKYLRDGAAKKTAELILQFVETGSFGRDCATVLLKS